MKRLILTVLVLLGAFAACFAQAPEAASKRPDLLKRTPFAFSQSGTQIRLYSSDVKEPVRIFVISDTHLYLSDAREDAIWSVNTEEEYHESGSESEEAKDELEVD